MGFLSTMGIFLWFSATFFHRLIYGIVLVILFPSLSLIKEKRPDMEDVNNVTLVFILIYIVTLFLKQGISYWIVVFYALLALIYALYRGFAPVAKIRVKGITKKHIKNGAYSEILKMVQAGNAKANEMIGEQIELLEKSEQIVEDSKRKELDAILKELDKQKIKADEPKQETKKAKTKKKQKNMGTYLRDETHAHNYWVGMGLATYTPVIIYRFKTLEEARKAILSISYIHESDGDLIASETVDYGCYLDSNQDGIVIISGHGLTRKLFDEAKQKLIKAGGIVFNEQEPKGEDKKVTSKKQKAAKPKEKVRFVRKDRKRLVTGTYATYETYSAPSEAVAKAFLATKSVTQPMYYVVVDTPSGSWGKDCEGIYKE